MLKRVLAILLVSAGSIAQAELVHQFQSPAFIPGNGYSQHVLSIHQIESGHEKDREAKKQAEIAAAESAKKNTNLYKFMTNVEARIYAQLSKQLADNMFAEGSGTSGSMDFQGTNITWVKTGTDVTLTIIEPSGSRTEITVPIASFAF